MDEMRKHALMDIETCREVKTDLRSIWKPGERGEVGRNQMTWIGEVSKLEFTGGMDKLKDSEKHQERLRDSERLTDFARQQQITDSERHELRMTELKNLCSIERKKIELETSRRIEMLRQFREEELYNRQKIAEAQQNENVRQMSRMSIKELEARQTQMEKHVQQMERQAAEEREMTAKRHMENLCNLERKYEQEWKAKIMEMEQKLEKERKISQHREEKLLKLIGQHYTPGETGLAKTLIEMDRNKDVESVPEARMLGSIDLQGKLNRLEEENISEGPKIYDRQRVARKQEMADTKLESGMKREEERHLQVQEHLENISEIKQERDKEMEKKRDEERCHKDYKDIPREWEKKLEKEGDAEQKKEQELLKQEEDRATAKEIELLKMASKNEIAENKRTTGVEKLINKGKEWMVEIKQKVQKNSEASLQDGQEILGEEEAQNKSSEKQGEHVAKMETPVKAMRKSLREFRSKDEKCNDMGKEMLVNEEHEKPNTTTTQMEVVEEVEQKPDQLMDDWFGEMLKKKSTARKNNISFREGNGMTMEEKKRADQQEKRVEAIKSQETTKTTLKKEGMEWLEEIKQNVAEKKHTERGLQQTQQTSNRETVRDVTAVEGRRARVSERMEMEQVEKDGLFDDWFGEMDSKCDKEREKKQKPSDDWWNEFAGTGQKKQDEAVNNYDGEVNNRSETKWTNIKKKRQEAEEMLKKASKSIMEGKTSTDQQETQMAIMKKDALTKEGIPWLEDIELNLTDRKHSERELQLGQQVRSRAGRERVHGRKMDEGQENGVLGEMDIKCQRQREKNVEHTKQNTNEVKDSDRDFNEKFGIMDDKGKSDEMFIRNRRLTDEENCDTQQFKKKPLDWLGEKEQRMEEKRMQEITEKRQKRLVDKKQEMENKKEREMTVEQHVRLGEVEEKAKAVKLLLTDIEENPGRKEIAMLQENVNIFKSSPNDRLFAESDKHRNTKIDNVSKRLRLTQNISSTEFIKPAWEKNKDLQTVNETELKHNVSRRQRSSQLLEMEKEKERQRKWEREWEEVEKQKEMKEMITRPEKVETKQSRPSREKIRQSKSDKPKMETVPQRQRVAQNDIDVKSAWCLKKEKAFQADTEREQNHDGWLKSSRLLEREKEKDRQEKEKERQRNWETEWEQELAKQSGLKEMVTQQQRIEIKQSRPSDNKSESGVEMEPVPRRQRLSQNWATSDMKTASNLKTKTTELKPGNDGGSGRLKSPKLLDTDKEKEGGRNWNRQWEEEMAKQKESKEMVAQPHKVEKKHLRVSAGEARAPESDKHSTVEMETVPRRQTLIQSPEKEKNNHDFCEVVDLELHEEDEEMKTFHDSEESTSKKVRGFENEKPIMPLESGEECQENTKQELPEDNAVLSKEQSAIPIIPGEGEVIESMADVNEEKLEDTSPRLDEKTTNNTAKKDKSIRRRIFNWANEKAKEYYSKKIEKTIVREAEEGGDLYFPWYSLTPKSRGQREREKRKTYLKAEERRQRIEKCWQNLQIKWAEEKEIERETEREWERMAYLSPTPHPFAYPGKIHW